MADLTAPKCPFCYKDTTLRQELKSYTCPEGAADIWASTWECSSEQCMSEGVPYRFEDPQTMQLNDEVTRRVVRS